MALEDRSLPDRGWYIFVGTMSVIAGIVMLAWPFRSLAAATAVAGIWLVAIGAGDVLWALRARRTFRDVRRTAERLTGSPAGPPAQRSSARDITTR